jgi:3',5'-cyclic AMP phosphodiesterase CpdA
MTKKNGGDFKILQLADTQLSDAYKDIKRTFDIITQAIEATTPDLLMLTGDNVAGLLNGPKGYLLVSFLDSFEIPYAAVMGNHDGEGLYDIEKMGEVYASGKYSLFVKGPDSIHGTGNYGINIADENGEIVYALVMIDTNRYRTYEDGKNGYDYIYPDQIAWYEWYIKGVSETVYGSYDPDGGKVVKSLLFHHIPLPEIDDIRSEIEGADAPKAADAFREDPCPPLLNTGMFAKVTALKSTTHTFFGHDHVNMINYEYQGVYFVYGAKTGPCSYYDADRQGTTLITIKNDLSIGVEFLLV